MTDAELIAEARNYEGDNGTARWPSLIVELGKRLESRTEVIAAARARAYKTPTDGMIGLVQILDSDVPVQPSKTNAELHEDFMLRHLGIMPETAKS